MQAKKEMEAIKALSERVPKRIITNGKRNTYYLIGKQNATYSGGSSAGQLVLFVSSISIYQDCIPAYFIVNSYGECSKHSIVEESGVLKKIMAYTDDTHDYIFLYAPNYHDNFYVDLVSSYNFNLDVEAMTADEFNTYVANMTKLSEV